jgi:SAM-dependent methyltransferase
MSTPPSPLATPEPWNLVAAAYTAEVVPWFEAYARDALALAELAPGAEVLDVATGPGTLALMAAAAGAKVAALDFSEAMVAALRARARDRGVAVDVRVGDGQALPYPDGRFAAGFSMFGLMFFPDRAAGLRELHRVLRPGGRAVVASWAPFEGAFAAVMESLRQHLPGLPFGAGKAPLGSAEEITAEMRAAGFASVAVHPRMHVLPQPSLDAFWQSVQRTTAPVVLLRQRLGEAGWAKVAAGVHADLERQFGSGAVDEEATALIGVASKA